MDLQSRAMEQTRAKQTPRRDGNLRVAVCGGFLVVFVGVALDHVREKHQRLHFNNILRVEVVGNKLPSGVSDRAAKKEEQKKIVCFIFC